MAALVAASAPCRVSAVIASGRTRSGSATSGSVVMYTRSAPVATPMPTFVPVRSSSSGPNRASSRCSSPSCRGCSDGHGAVPRNHRSTMVAANPGTASTRPRASLATLSARLPPSGSGPAPRARARDGHRPLRGPADHDHRWVRGHHILERGRVMHLNDRLNPERARDHAPQLSTVGRPHPPIRADEPQHPAVFQLTQPGLDEPHVNVTPADHRRVQAPVGRQCLGGKVVIPHIRRIAHDQIRPPIRRGRQQVITDAHPAFSHFPGLQHARTMLAEFPPHELRGPGCRISVQLIGVNRLPRI